MARADGGAHREPGGYLRGFPFGDAVAVRDGMSGQVWLLEGDQADAWRFLPPADQPAAPVLATDDPAPIPPGGPALALTVALEDVAVRIRCWDPLLARTFTGPLAAFVQDGLPPSRTIDLYEADDGPVVAVDGRVAHRPGSLPSGRWLAMRRLAVELSPGRHWLLLLHAASVAMPFGTVVLAAASGSGKTTLAGALLAAGGSLLSDDLTPIEAGTLHAWPFPMAMSVKEGSWPLFARMNLAFAAVEPVSIGASRVRYFPPGRVAGRRGHPVAAVIVPCFRRGAVLECTKLRPVDLLRGLVATGTWPPPSDAGLAEMLAWLERVPAYRLTYGDLDQAIGEIHAIGGTA